MQTRPDRKIAFCKCVVLWEHDTKFERYLENTMFYVVKQKVRLIKRSHATWKTRGGFGRISITKNNQLNEFKSINNTLSEPHLTFHDCTEEIVVFREQAY